jgi:hypothetical protein
VSRAFACVALLGVAACPTPSDVTPLIHVDPRAAQRLEWFGERPAAGEPVPPPPSPARVHAMKEGEELGGPGATGRPGDWLLENAQVVFVIGQVGGDGGSAGSGGNVIDAADARFRKDDLGCLATSFGTTPPEGMYRSLRSGADAEGSAWIEVTGRGLTQATLALTTRYTLQAPDRALLLETTLENTGDAPIALASLGDRIAWGTAETVVPGEERGFAGPSSGVYVGAVGADTSYALTSTDGSIEAVSGESWTQTAQRKRVTLAPHARSAYARVLVVGARPDTASLVGELALAAGLPVGEVKVMVAGSASGTTLLLTPEGSHQPLTLVEPFEAMLPEGRYWITPLEGHRPIGPLDVKANHSATATVENVAAPAAAATSAP